MVYQPTCNLWGHAEKAKEQRALREAQDDLSVLRNKWRRRMYGYPSVQTA